jgi:hypothetical protein
MNKIWLTVLLCISVCAYSQQNSDNRFRRPLKEVLTDLQSQFGVRLRFSEELVRDKVLDYADWRIHPWSLEESLNNVLLPFDYKFVKESSTSYEIKAFEYARRTADFGRDFLDYLSSRYADLPAWEARKALLKKEMKIAAGLDPLPRSPGTKPILGPKRKYEGYYVQNIALEILPGVFCTGSIYHPIGNKGKCPIMLNPNGHFGDGRYRADQQLRCAMQARMGIIAVSYDLFAWDEQLLQFDSRSHRSSMAHTIQSLNAIRMLDYLCALKEADLSRVGITGGSGGGSQTMFITAIDERITLSMPVVMTSSYFVGGCPCESGNPIHLCGGRTNNAEITAMCAPRPLLVVSDGKDWTKDVPHLEFPYIRSIYALYGKEDLAENAHFGDEGHDYGFSKRQATYTFIEKHWNLNTKGLKNAAGQWDESEVTVEPYPSLKVFGADGKGLPTHAVKGMDELYRIFEAAKQ